MTGDFLSQPSQEPARHTATPWMTHRAGEMLPNDWMIMADMGHTPNGIQQVSTVARALSIRQTPEVTAANAALIVEAVNSHASLKADNEGLRKALNAVSVPADVRKLKARIEELEAAQEQFISDLASSVNEISATDRQKEVFKASLRYAITHAKRLAADRAALPQSSGVARAPT